MPVSRTCRRVIKSLVTAAKEVVRLTSLMFQPASLAGKGVVNVSAVIVEVVADELLVALDVVDAWVDVEDEEAVVVSVRVDDTCV